MATTTERQTLKDRKALLEKGPLNWTDYEITQIATFTSIPAADLTTMRHKMERASQRSIRNLTALDRLIDASPNSARLRKRIERKASVKDGIDRARTYGGLLQRVKIEVDAIDEQLKSKR